jgi:hypothetical protein
MNFSMLTVPKQTEETFHAAKAESWETWHKQFGHISYDGLQKLLDKSLVNGFTVDTSTPQPDCMACTEAKIRNKPYKATATKHETARQLTHIDVWGKYEIASINQNHYFILMVDDATQYITVHFLKTKDQAAQNVINYLTHLKMQNKPLHAIRTDGGHEFLNENLKSWCTAQGIKQHITAPYSPSQNGVAERMNQTLIELGWAMLTSAKLPKFLWEPAITHATYLQNHSYMVALGDQTPYERWHGNKPSITHLREFSTPVWILAQGQKIPRKMLPKSHRHAYIGYNDGSDSVLYYNAETRKILAS